MTEIRTLAKLKSDDLHRLVTGYSSDAKYQISKTESDERFSLTLELVPLPQPYHKRYDHLDAETLDQYQQVAALGFSFGAYDAGQCLGIALAEPRTWNRSLWVWELHVAETHRRRGAGINSLDLLPCQRNICRPVGWRDAARIPGQGAVHGAAKDKNPGSGRTRLPVSDH